VEGGTKQKKIYRQWRKERALSGLVAKKRVRSVASQKKTKKKIKGNAQDTRKKMPVPPKRRFPGLNR